MLKKALLILLLLASMSGAGYVTAQQLQWQEAKHASISDSDVEIFGKDGEIVIKTNRKIHVRVFTILGQLVNQATLNPGENHLRVNSRGIYIVKVENRPQKVAL